MNRWLTGLQRPGRPARVPDQGMPGAVQADPAGQTRPLLTALAWGRGPGLPEGAVAAVARALAEATGEDGRAVTTENVRRLLRKTKGLVTQAPGPGGLPVCQVADGTLAAQLRAGPEGAAGAGVRGGLGWRARCERAVTAGLLDTVPVGEAGRDWASAHPYLRAHLPGHAAAAGGGELAGLLGDLGFLAVADPAVVGPLLSVPDCALRDLGRTYWRARPLLGGGPRADVACLAEVFRGVTGTAAPATGVRPLYRTHLALVPRDDSLLSLRHTRATNGQPGTPNGPAGAVNGVALAAAADGRLLLASGCEDGTVHVWDPLAGTRVSGPLRGHTGWVNRVAFGTVPAGAAGGRLLVASAGKDGTARVWDALSGEPVSVLTGHTDWVLGVAFGTAPDGRLLLASAGADDGTVRVWDPLAGTPVGEPLTGHQVAPNPVVTFAPTVNDVAFGTMPDGRLLLASGGIDRTVRLWDPLAGTSVGEPLTGHLSGVLCLAFGTAEDGRAVLASGAAANADVIRLWDPLTGTSLGHLPGHTRGVHGLSAVTTTGGGLLLASAGGNEETVRLWDPLAGTPAGEPLVGHTSTVYFVALGSVPGTGAVAGGRLLLASCGHDSTVRLWDPNPRPAARGHGGHARWVEAVALWRSPAGGLLAACADGAAGTVVVWDVLAGKALSRPVAGHRGRVLCLAFGTGPEGAPLLAWAGEDRMVRVWHPLTGTPAAALAGHEHEVRSVAFGTVAGGGEAGGQRPLLASAGDDGELRLWDPLTGIPLDGPRAGHRGSVEAVAFGTGSGAGPLLASAGEDGLVRVWDAVSGAPAAPPLAGHTGAVRSVAFGTSADGATLLATGGDDQTVRLWDPLTGAVLGEPLAGHDAWVRSVAFGTVKGDGEAGGGRPVLASAAADQTVRVWDPAAGTCLAVLRRRSSIRSLAASGLTLAVGEDEGMSVLELDSAALS